MKPAVNYQHDYAFSYALYGIQAPPKEDHALLRVCNWSSSAAQADRCVDTAAETAPEEKVVDGYDEMNLGLWVGMCPARAGVLRAQQAEAVGDDTETQTAFDTIKENKIKRGSSVNSLSQLKELPIWPLDRDVTRVVVRFNQHVDRLIYYKLINRDPKTKVSLLHSTYSSYYLFLLAMRGSSHQLSGLFLLPRVPRRQAVYLERSTDGLGSGDKEIPGRDAEQVPD
jgi:hypothetical protein